MFGGANMKTNRFHFAMFAIIIAANVLWLEPFRDPHRGGLYLERTDVELYDFVQNSQGIAALKEPRYEFHWPPGQGPGFHLVIKEEILNNSQHVVAGANLLFCFVWAAGIAILRIMSPRGQNNGRPEPAAPPNGGPAAPSGGSGAGGGPPSVS
jgi:hypothetical protein